MNSIFSGKNRYAYAAAFNSACFAAALSRFGLVGVISFWIFFYLSYLFPVSFNSSSLYFPGTIINFVIAFGLAVYAFYISIAGQKIFHSELLNKSEN